MEIERKFLVNKIPENLENYEKIEIEQGYLTNKPTIRIRKANGKYILTIKSKFGVSKCDNGSIVNNEHELEITAKEYEHLKKKIDGRVLKKKRYIIPLDNGLKVELDIFKERLFGLVFAEVEFQSLEMADNFVKPDWLGRDVSDDKRYRNSSIVKLDKYSDEYFKEKI